MNEVVFVHQDFVFALWLTMSHGTWGVQFRDAGNGKTGVDWTYTVEPVATQTHEQFTTFMRGFYLYNLNILQSAANIAATSTTATALESAQEQQQTLVPYSTTCKPIQLRS